MRPLPLPAFGKWRLGYLMYMLPKFATNEVLNFGRRQVHVFFVFSLKRAQDLQSNFHLESLRIAICCASAIFAKCPILLSSIGKVEFIKNFGDPVPSQLTCIEIIYLLSRFH